MCKPIVLFFIGCFLASSERAYSQFFESVGLHFGQATSALISTWPDAAPQVMDDWTGPVGLVSIHSFNGLIRMRTDIGHIQKGGVQFPLPSPFGYSPAPTYYKHEYVTISPMVLVEQSWGPMVATVMVGPHIDLQTGYKTNGNSPAGERVFQEPIFGITYGGGVGCRMGRSTLLIQYQGRPDLTKYESSPRGSGWRLRSSSYLVMMGIIYRLRKSVGAATE